MFEVKIPKEDQMASFWATMTELESSAEIQHDPGFAKTYLQEKAYLLSVMNKGNPELYKLALQNIVG